MTAPKASRHSAAVMRMRCSRGGATRRLLVRRRAPPTPSGVSGPARRRDAVAPATSGPSPERPLELLHEAAEMIPAGLEVRILVIARAGRREQDGLTRACGRRGGGDRALQVAHLMDGGTRGGESVLELAGRLADEVDGPAALGHHRREGREVLVLAAAPRNEVHPAPIAPQRDE